MESLEKIARLEWDMFGTTEGWVQKEFVALGFAVDEGFEMDRTGGSEVWYELTNLAAPNSEGRGEFLVEGPELECVMQIAMHEGLGNTVRMLWHTHTETIAPSAEDIAEFPAWLVHYGMVYHVPSGTTTLYNSAGVISTSTKSPIALGTGDNHG